MYRKALSQTSRISPHFSDQTLRTTRVLVVEDEVVTSEVISLHLKHLGYEVAGEATSGREAIDLISRTRPDLVLVDIVLGSDTYDGIDLAREIRYRYGLPVVFLTAHSDRATLERAKGVGAFGYVLKPFQESHIRVAIETALGTFRLERTIAQQQQLVTLILNSAQDGIIATDLEGMILFLNTAAERMTGWQLPESMGKSLSEVIQFADRQTGSRLGTLVRPQEKQPYSLGDAIVLLRRDQSSVSVAGHVVPLSNGQGDTLGQIMLLTRTGEHHRIQALESELEIQRQSELEIQTLLDQEKEFNQLKTRMIAMISHEFRNPLTTFSMAMELLRVHGAQIDTVRRETYLNQMKAASSRMNRLIESVVIFSQIESGHFKFSPVLLDLQDFCWSLVNEHQLLAGDRHCISLDYHGMHQATLDRELLSHAISNILTNAVKYSPRGGTISFRVWAESEQIICRIRDQGMGIPTADQANLFQLFYRGSNVESIAGTGVGLAIVKRCVDLHQGTIDLQSQLGQGTEMTLTLPQIRDLTLHQPRRSLQQGSTRRSER